MMELFIRIKDNAKLIVLNYNYIAIAIFIFVSFFLLQGFFPNDLNPFRSKGKVISVEPYTYISKTGRFANKTRESVRYIIILNNGEKFDIQDYTKLNEEILIGKQVQLVYLYSLIYKYRSVKRISIDDKIVINIESYGLFYTWLFLLIWVCLGLKFEFEKKK